MGMSLTVPRSCLGLLALRNLKSFKCDFQSWSREDEAAIARLIATHPSLESLTRINYASAWLFQEAQLMVTAGGSKLRQLQLYDSEPLFDDLQHIMVYFLRDRSPAVSIPRSPY